MEWEEEKGEMSQENSKPSKANFIRSYGQRIILFGWMFCFPSPHEGGSALLDHGYSLASEVLSEGTCTIEIEQEAPVPESKEQTHLPHQGL